MDLTKKEKNILDILWEFDKPMCVADITAVNNTLKKNTVTVLLKKMLDKNLVYVADIRKNGKTLAQYYKPTVNKDSYVLSSLSDKQALNVAAMFIEQDASNEDLDYLLQLINEKKKK